MTLRRIYLAILATCLLAGAGFAFYYYASRDEIPKSEVASAPDRESGEQDYASIPPDEVVERAWAFYQSRPYFQRPQPPSEIPEGLPNTRAATCGACHVEIYEEWKLSTHRRAWLDDAQFVAELEKSRGQAKADGTLPDDAAHRQKDVGWMCVNCHTPSIRQLPELVVGLKDGAIDQPIYAKNPDFDPEFQKEAISCATCHVRDGVVYGPFGDTDAPHATAKDPKLLTPETCTQCHNAQATFPAQNLGCFFTTGEEWAASDYSKTEQSCQSCHMPHVKRKLAGAFDRPPRMTRRHWFGGSLIPKKPEFSDELKPLQEVYGSGVDIELVTAPKDAQPAGDLDPEFGADSTRCAPNQPCLRLWVRLSNRNAGHKFPTGDPERHADIHIRATNAHGELLAQASDRVASRYQWWPKIKKLTDNRILPGAHHDIPIEIPLDSDLDKDSTAEAISVEINAHKYRMYPEAFEHHDLQDKYVRGREFHTSKWRVTPGGAPSLIIVTDDSGTRDTLAPAASP